MRRRPADRDTRGRFPLLTAAVLAAILGACGTGDPVTVGVCDVRTDPGAGRHLRIEFRNLSDRPIRAVRILVDARDAAGAPVRPGETSTVSAADRPFLGPGETRRDVFPVDRRTESATVTVLEVVFAEGQPERWTPAVD